MLSVRRLARDRRRWLLSRAKHAASLDTSTLLLTARLRAGDAFESFGQGCGAVLDRSVVRADTGARAPIEKCEPFPKANTG